MNKMQHLVRPPMLPHSSLRRNMWSMKLLVPMLFMQTTNPDQYLAMPTVKLLASKLFMRTTNPDQYLSMRSVKIPVSLLFMLTRNPDQYLALPVIHQQPQTVMSIQAKPPIINATSQKYNPEVHSDSKMNPLIGQPSCSKL